MYLLSAYFDGKTEKKIRKTIENIAKHTGNSFMVDNQIPPHLTIAAIEAISDDSPIAAFDELKGNLYAGDITFVSVGQLLPYVMYITPVLNEYLQFLSLKIEDTYKKFGNVRLNKYYRPYSWLPHVTVGKTLTKEQMRVAFAVLQDSFSPFDARIVSIGIAKTNPHRDIELMELEAVREC